MTRFIYEPEKVTIIGTGHDEPMVPLHRFDAAALREHFRNPPRWQPEQSDEARLSLSSKDWKPAAVLIPLVVRESGLDVLLTMRTAHLHDHASQISFPGGRWEQGDADLIATALREAEEETGLADHYIEVLGVLPDYHTISGYRVAPVVGLVNPAFELIPDAFEVEEVFEVPLNFLMNPANHQVRAIEVGSIQRRFYSMPYPKALSKKSVAAPTSGTTDRGADESYFIWGATAAIIRNLYHFLKAT
ncbi:NUDIX hydrolase [Ampullimonas aquatilis]|uniref:NUDIX hydrolase n=1 Tax=Ampullimonas aquatilis TaxID=1341549 RepID=UPI003C745D5E